MTSHTFFSSSSHTVTQAFDCVATHELLRELIQTLACDFASKANPGDILRREPAELQPPKETTGASLKVLVIGASHGSRLAVKLKLRDCNVTNLAIPGWLPTDSNLAKLEDELTKLGDLTDTHVIVDLFSNSAYRYVSEDDGSLAPPMKIDGVYHMGGKVTTCANDVLGTIVSKAKKMFTLLKGKVVVLPPLPRYLYSSCCSRPGHCQGAGTKETVERLLDQTLALKKPIVNALIKNGIQNFTVPDTLQLMFGETIEKIDAGLQKVSSVDGVHLTHNGYSNLADVVKKLVTPDTASCSAAGAETRTRTSFFWRGFVSPVGTPRPKQNAQAYKQARVSSGHVRKFTTGSRRGGPSGSFGRGRGRGASYGKKF